MKKNTLFIMVFTVFMVFTGFTGDAPAKDRFGIPFMGDVSGTIGFWNGPRLAAFQDAIEYINRTHGGIGGREVFVDYLDTKSKTDMAMTGYAKFTAKGFPLWHTCGTGEMMMLKQAFEKDRNKVVFTCAVAPEVLYPPGYMFGTAPDYVTQWAAFADWLNETWDYGTHGRNPRIAILTYKSAFGQILNRKELRAFFTERKIDVVLNETIPFVTTDPLTPLLKAKRKKADWCVGSWIFQTLPPYLTANHKHKLGLKFAVPNIGVDKVMILNSEPREAAVGLVGVTNWNLPWEDTEGMKLVREMWEKKNRRPEDRSASYILGWMNVWLTKKAIEETLERVGSWDAITPRELRITSEGWGKFDINGLGTVTYSKNSRGPNEARVVQVVKKQIDGKEVIRWDYASDWRQLPDLFSAEMRTPLPY